MNLAVISEVAGCPWAGSEELWLATAMLARQGGWEVVASLHTDLHEAQPIKAFVDAGGGLVAWKRPPIARFAGLHQRLVPNFSRSKLGDPDVLLLSAGALPSMINLPGLTDFLDTSGIPYIVLCQFNADCLPISPDERLKIRKLLLNAAKCVFVSEHNRSLAERQCGIRLPAAEVILNPIRTILDSPLPPPGSDRVEFACVARMQVLWKGQDLLLDILSADSWKRREWRLHFYGTGPDLDYVKQWSEQCGLGEKVVFHGYVRSVEAIWSDCDLMVLPSRGEGTPLAVLEAMMCGRPVVTTDVGGNAEVLEEGVTGFIAEAATPASFGAALERAWQARELWPEMGLAAHRRAQDLAAERPDEELYGLLSRSAGTR